MCILLSLFLIPLAYARLAWITKVFIRIAREIERLEQYQQNIAN
jgi:hypothetical protein